MEEQPQQQSTPQPEKPKKKFYKRWWVWVVILIAFLVFLIILSYSAYPYGGDFLNFVYSKDKFVCKCVTDCTYDMQALGQGQVTFEEYTRDEYNPIVVHIVKGVYFGIPLNTIKNNCPEGSVQGREVE